MAPASPEHSTLTSKFMGLQTQPLTVFASAAGWGFCLHSAFAGQTQRAQTQGRRTLAPAAASVQHQEREPGAGGAKNCLSLNHSEMRNAGLEVQIGARACSAASSWEQVWASLTFQLWRALCGDHPAFCGSSPKPAQETVGHLWARVLGASVPGVCLCFGVCEASVSQPCLFIYLCF